VCELESDSVSKCVWKRFNEYLVYCIFNCLVDLLCFSFPQPMGNKGGFSKDRKVRNGGIKMVKLESQ